MRSSGNAGSIGTYAPPAFNIPKMAAIASAVRSIKTATGTSPETPFICKNRASLSAF